MMLDLNKIRGDKSQILNYVDIFKGVIIFCIIWCHTDAPSAANDWTLGTYGNIFFFILSGFFFRPSGTTDFLKKKWKTLVIPFLFFYIASIPFCFLIDLWDYRSLSAFDWSRILDVFKVEARSDCLSLNVPIWFLMTLFVIQWLSVYLFRLPRYLIACLAILSIVFKDSLLGWPTMFMFNNALYWFGLFAVGNLTGKPIIKSLADNRFRCALLPTSLVVFAFCFYWIDISGRSDVAHLFIHGRHISTFFFFLTLFSFLFGSSHFSLLKYLGSNSLIILGAHLWFLIPLGRISFLLTHRHAPYICFVLSVICTLLLLPLISFLNSHLPALVGKERISKAQQGTPSVA